MIVSRDLWRLERRGMMRYNRRVYLSSFQRIKHHLSTPHGSLYKIIMIFFQLPGEIHVLKFSYKEKNVDGLNLIQCKCNRDHADVCERACRRDRTWRWRCLPHASGSRRTCIPTRFLRARHLISKSMSTNKWFWIFIWVGVFTIHGIEFGCRTINELRLESGFQFSIESKYAFPCKRHSWWNVLLRGLGGVLNLRIKNCNTQA